MQYCDLPVYSRSDAHTHPPTHTHTTEQHTHSASSTTSAGLRAASCWRPSTCTARRGSQTSPLCNISSACVGGMSISAVHLPLRSNLLRGLRARSKCRSQSYPRRARGMCSNGRFSLRSATSCVYFLCHDSLALALVSSPPPPPLVCLTQETPGGGAQPNRCDGYLGIGRDAEARALGPQHNHGVCRVGKSVCRNLSLLRVCAAKCAYVRADIPVRIQAERVGRRAADTHCLCTRKESIRAELHARTHAHFLRTPTPHQVSDLTPLQDCSRLAELFCVNAPVSDLAPLSHLRHLHTLDLRGTPVMDVSPLVNCVALSVLGVCFSPRSWSLTFLCALLTPLFFSPFD